MKKLTIGILVIFCCLFFILVANADERRIEWEQDQPTFDAMDHWELSWSDASSGPYTTITNVQKPISPPQGGIYALGPYDLTVGGTPGETVTKYFVMRAVMLNGVTSDWSNEATSDFLIGIGATFNLKVLVITVPE